MVTTKQMREYIERMSEKRIESAINDYNVDKMRELIEKACESQMRLLAKKLMVTYAKTEDRWFLYVRKDQGINERDGVYSCSINHILLTFRTEEEYKKALSNINKKPLCRVMYRGEITPEMINKLRGMVEWQD
jgi:hypothetical protein